MNNVQEELISLYNEVIGAKATSPFGANMNTIYYLSTDLGGDFYSNRLFEGVYYRDLLIWVEDTFGIIPSASVKITGTAGGKNIVGNSDFYYTDGENMTNYGGYFYLPENATILHIGLKNYYTDYAPMFDLHIEMKSTKDGVLKAEALMI